MKIFGRTTTLLATACAVTMGAALVVVWQELTAQEAENQRLQLRMAELDKQVKQSVVMQRVNAQMEEIADDERRISEEQRDKAEQQTLIAEQMRLNAEDERKNALEAEQRAVKSSEQAERQRAIAEQQRLEAEYRKRVADTLSYLSMARQLGDVAIRQAAAGNHELGSLLAYGAQRFTQRYGGDEYASSIYQSLVMTSLSKKQWTRHKGPIYDIAFFDDSRKHFLSCSSYGELVEHEDRNGNLASDTLLCDPQFDFRDIYIDRGRGIIYAVSRTGHLLRLYGRRQDVIVVDRIGELLTIAPAGKQMLLFGENGMALIDTDHFTIVKTKQARSRIIDVCSVGKCSYIFDDQGMMYSVYGIDKVNAQRVPVEGQVTAYARNDANGMEVYGMKDGNIYLKQPGKNIQKLSGHRSRITKVKIINWRIHSSSYDGTVNLWMADQAKIEPMTIVTTQSWVLNFTFDINKDAIWCADQKGILTEAYISVPLMRKMLQQRLKRNLTHEEWNYYIGRTIPYEKFIP